MRATLIIAALAVVLATGVNYEPRHDAVVIQLGSPPSTAEVIRDGCRELFQSPETGLAPWSRVRLAATLIGSDLVSDVPTLLKTVTIAGAGLGLAIRYPHGIPMLLVLALFGGVLHVTHALYRHRNQVGLMPFPLVALYAVALLFMTLAVIGLTRDEIETFSLGRFKSNLGL